MAKENKGTARYGAHRAEFEKNRKRILESQDVCGICGRPVDKSLKYPHPLAPCVDHIIPLAKGGHPSARDNLQLAHWTCNRQKSDKIMIINQESSSRPEAVGLRNLPHLMDWSKYAF